MHNHLYTRRGLTARLLSMQHLEGAQHLQKPCKWWAVVISCAADNKHCILWSTIVQFPLQSTRQFSIGEAAAAFRPMDRLTTFANCSEAGCPVACVQTRYHRLHEALIHEAILSLRQ